MKGRADRCLVEALRAALLRDMARAGEPGADPLLVSHAETVARVLWLVEARFRAAYPGEAPTLGTDPNPLGVALSILADAHQALIADAADADRAAHAAAAAEVAALVPKVTGGRKGKAASMQKRAAATERKWRRVQGMKAQGMTQKEVAGALGMTPRGVRPYW